MPARRAPLPPTVDGSAFTVADGRAAGLTADQLRRTSLRSPTYGVRSGRPAPAPDDVRTRCAELLPALPGGALYCHVTALALLGVDLPRGLDPTGPLHVSTGPGASRVRRPGVVAHRRSVDAPGILLPGRIPVLAPPWLFAQLATLPRTELVVLGDALTRRRRPATRVEKLVDVVAGLPPGTRGIRRLREAVELVRAGTDSPMETRLRLLLVDAGLPCPVVNRPVRDEHGAVLAMPDLSYPEQRVAIEYDGDVHRTSRTTWRRDVARRQSLEALGWRVVSCTADDVLHHPERPARWVRAALAASEPTPRGRGSGASRA